MLSFFAFIRRYKNKRLTETEGFSVCLLDRFAAEEMNVVGAASTSGENEEDPLYPWSPGTLKYYGRAELKTSDHRYDQHTLVRV